MVVRRLLASRMTMSTASATLTGLGGLWGGLLVAGWIFSSSDTWRPAMIGVAALVAAIVVVIVSLIVAYLHPRPGLEPIAEVAKRGEFDSLEFKSSARWNMRAGKRDDAMETVIAKTVAAFMNSGGGTLLIGVDDDGRLIGLGPDYATLKTPDADRFELWIRALWGQRLGTNAAAFQGQGRGRAVGACRQLDEAPRGRRRRAVRSPPLARIRARLSADPHPPVPHHEPPPRYPHPPAARRRARPHGACEVRCRGV